MEPDATSGLKRGRKGTGSRHGGAGLNLVQMYISTVKGESEVRTKVMGVDGPSSPNR